MTKTINKYLNSIWHDSDKEQPEHGSIVVVWSKQKRHGDILTDVVEVFSDNMWCYLKDILPYD